MRNENSNDGTASPLQKLVMPLQPIENGRFVANRIVTTLLDSGKLDMNDLACMEFTAQERIQFAQLIGYSLSGFSELSYVDDETYTAAEKASEGQTEEAARNETLREQLDEARKGIKAAASVLFRIHPDDLQA